MRLSKFIISNMEAILVEWEAFGRSLPAGSKLDRNELRDHAHQMLHAASKSMELAQTASQQEDKSKGDGNESAESKKIDDASKLHGIGRVASGFNLLELVAEYRALRASVLKLWRESYPACDPIDGRDVDRFNESIDQSLTCAIESYSACVDHSRQLFLAILGHDLRNPLQAIKSSASLLSRPGAVDPTSKWIVAQMSSTVIAMDRLISDLLDYTSASLGKSAPLKTASMNLAKLCTGIIEEMQVAHPTILFTFRHSGELSGDWDSGRLRQMISNLLMNAVHHGARERPIGLEVTKKSSEVTINVTNEGKPISTENIAKIFDPMFQGEPDVSPRRAGSVGLGLFIAREVAVAHGGRIEVESSLAIGTKFSVHLPDSPHRAVGSGNNS